MTLKLISATLLFGLFLTSCNLTKKTSNTANSDSHTSQNSLDWQGSYFGVTPCASCPGIETELTLTNDLNYVLTRKYIDNEETYTTEGKFSWEAQADNLSVTETSLSLNKARMAPLARFELVE